MVMMMVFCLLCVVALCSSFAFAYEEIHITQPPSLQHLWAGGKGMPHKGARFGVDPYGRTISAPLLILNDGNCADPLRMPKNFDCSKARCIIMMSRGPCNGTVETFVTKVRAAQHAGAVMAIIANNVPGYTPTMDTDGSGSDITIPSIHIPLDVAVNLTKAADSLPDKQYIWLRVEWYLPHPDGRVEMQLWTSSGDTSIRTLVQQMAKLDAQDEKLLASSVQLRPRYLLFDGTVVGCENGNWCGDFCTEGGLYCTIEHTNYDAQQAVTGRQTVEENLRQLVFVHFLIHQTETDMSARWWRFQAHFTEHCCAPNHANHTFCTPTYWGADCSYESMKYAWSDIDIDQVKEEVENSWGKDGFNSYLDAAVQKQYRYVGGFIYPPFVLINNATYEGGVNCPEPFNINTCGVLSAICDGFLEGTAPEFCGNDGCDVLDRGCHDTATSGGLGIGSVAFIVMLIVIPLAGIVFWYVRRKEQAMKHNLDQLLSRYTALEDVNHDDDQDALTGVVN